MSQNQNIAKLNQMKVFGMARAYELIRSSKASSAMTDEELITLLVEAEWEARENQKLQRLIKSAKFRYQASVEEIAFSKDRNLDKSIFLKLSNCDYIEKKGHEVDHSRLKKVDKMKRAIDLLDYHINDTFYELAEIELGLKYTYKGILFEKIDGKDLFKMKNKTPLTKIEKENNKKIRDLSIVLEQKTWDELGKPIVTVEQFARQ